MTTPQPAAPVPTYPFSDHHTLDLDPEFVDLYRVDELTRVELPYGGRAWLAVRYDHVRKVLTSPAMSRERANRTDQPRLSSEVLPRTSMMAMDDEPHARVRTALAAILSPAAVAALDDVVREDARAVVQDLIRRGPGADFVSVVAERLPVLTICRCLGLEPEQLTRFSGLAQALRAQDVAPHVREHARHRFEEHVRALVDATGLGSTWPASRTDPHARLDTAEVVDAVIALVVGGVGSPSTFLTSSMVFLSRQPELWARLVAAPGDVSALLVEELLRLVPIGVGGGFVRVATEDVLVGRTLVRAGQAVLPAMIAANRDPAVFPDGGRIVLGRPVTRHLGMGLGSHHCIGSQLARSQARILLEELASLAPTLRVDAAADELVCRPGLVVRELADLPVTWTP